MNRIRIATCTVVLVVAGLGATATAAQAFGGPGNDGGSRTSWSQDGGHRRGQWRQSRSDQADSQPDPDSTPADETAQPSAAETTQAPPAESAGTSGSVPSSSGQTLDVYLTGYGWWDNTPPGSAEISNPVLHSEAGGTGTYADPITVAVPYHCDNDCLQWPAGTKFYLPSLQRYLIVEDTCGDDGPDSCGDSNGNHLDVWVGGSGGSESASDACEDAITGDTTAIENPASDLAVTPGDIC
jgi:hypothetical protein